MDEHRGPEGREGQPGREGAMGREGPPGTVGASVTGDKGPRGPAGRSISNGVKIAFIIVTLIFFLTVCGFAWMVIRVQNLSEDTRDLVQTKAQLITANSNRIKEIQQTRVDNCKANYSGVRKVFRPFFPKKPRTLKQQADLDRFNRTIDGLKKDCKKPIKKPKKKPKERSS